MQQPGRPREFDSDEVMTKIMNLFWQQGYEATGLSDIIAATGLGKASLYAAFGNKQAMYLAAIGRYESLMVDGAVAGLRAADVQPLARVAAFLSAPIVALTDNDRRGCFLCNAAADRAAIDPDAGALVLQGYAKMRRTIEATLGDAFPDAGARLSGQAELVLALYSGLRVMARAGTAPEILGRARDAGLAALG